MVQGGGELISWAMTAYPDEFRRVEDEIITGLLAGTLNLADASTRLYQFTSEIRVRVLAFVNMAPDSDVRALIASQIDLLHHFKDVNLKACYEFGETGALSQDTILSLAQPSTQRLTAHGSTVLKAVIAGKDAQIVREPLTERDFDAIFEEFVRLDGNRDWLRATATRDFSNVSAEDRCQGSLTLLQAIINLPAPVAGRFLATH